jgi:hypothetical protein
MARSQNSFMKNQKAKKKQKARQEKLQRKIDKKEQEVSSDLDSMLAYVNENGDVVNGTPPPEDELSNKNKNK